jgi:hypothetical protein
MKTHLIQTLLILTILSSNSYAQDFLQNHKFLVKTNLVQSKLFQQWNITTEFKTPNHQQSNAYTIGYNRLRDIKEQRDGIYIGYSRAFYSKPIENCIFFSAAPYSKLIYRKVYQEGRDSFLFPFLNRADLNFQSISLALGINVESHFLIKKRLLISPSIGIGMGTVLFEIKNYASRVHFDGQLGINVGYIF